MLATLHRTIVEARSCAACGRVHRFAVAWLPEDGEAGRPVHGFFAPCAETGQRVWFVVSLPTHLDGSSRVVEITPDDGEDDAHWAAQRCIPERSEAMALGPLPDLSPRGTLAGGFRVPGRGPELLRMALGCPH